MYQMSHLFNTARAFKIRSAISGLLLGSLAATSALHAEAPASATPVPEKRIEWRTELDSTLAEAKSQNKLVLLRFTASWCAPCRVMDARVWPDPEVQTALAEKYLLVKSDVDEEATLAIARKYGVKAVPTLIILDANGEEIGRDGFMSPPQLIKFLKTSSKADGESDLPAPVSS